MPRRIILLSGHIASGKSTLAIRLVERYKMLLFKTQRLIVTTTGAELERAALQAAGEALDRDTNGRWVCDAVTRELQRHPEDVAVLVDSVRIREQCDAFRRAYGSGTVVHLHLTAPKEVLACRYEQRRGPMQELPSYDAVLADPTEAQVERLREIADIVIDTDRSDADGVFIRAASRLGLYARGVDQLVDVLVGGQWGSEGKGNVSGHLAPEYDVLVRVGGPNAGHQVYDEPSPWKFYHLPSGTMRAPKAKIVLGPGSTLWLPKLQQEITDCQLEPQRLCIDPQAMMIEKVDREREGNLKKKIGSTGQGVGAATSRKVLRTSARPPVRLARDIPELKPYLRETLAVLDDAFKEGQHVFLEGTQGTGLSLHHGSYPYVTSRDTTVSGCLADAGIPPGRVRRIVMVCRTYPIRVESPTGATSGPMGIEITWDVVADRAGLVAKDIAEAELTTTTNRPRRVAEFNWAMLRRAVSLNAPTDIALSFSDYLDQRNAEARRFDQLTSETLQLIEEVERVASAPVSLIVTRFDFRNIIDRRTW